LQSNVVINKATSNNNSKKSWVINMPKYAIYIDVHDESALLLPHKAGRMGFDISAIKYGRSMRLVYEENWNHVPNPEKILTLDEIEKALDVTVKIDKETGEPLKGLDFDFACPVMVAKLKQWLPKNSQEKLEYYKSSKYEWKHFDDIDGLMQQINSKRESKTRFALSPTEAFYQLCATTKLSDVQEEQLWQIAERIEESELWEKAEELAITNPEHPLASIRRAKELKIENFRFALAVSLLKRPIKNQVLVLFKIYSLGKEKIPPGLKLLPLNEHGQPEYDSDNEICQIIADGNRTEIYLPIFCAQGERLIIAISLGDHKHYEYFVVANK
jgi:Protein of unknown function (DUF1822)